VSVAPSGDARKWDDLRMRVRAATGELALGRPTITGMSRRANPENIYLARRAAILSILIGSGVSSDLAEELVGAWEADAEARGLPRLERTFWEGASDWTMALAHPHKRVASRPS
jgi:hypothetical protein